MPRWRGFALAGRGARRRDAELAGVGGYEHCTPHDVHNSVPLVHRGLACALELLYAKVGMLLARVSNKCIFNWMFLLCDSFAHSLIICLKKREKEVIEIGMAA